MARSSLAGVAALALLCGAVAGCNDTGTEGSPQAASTGQQQEADAPEVPPVKVTTNVRRKNVAVDAQLKLAATGGTLRKVTVKSSVGKLDGRLQGDEHWVATGRLEPGVEYHVKAVAERSDGQRVVDKSSFRTDDLTLDEQTYPSVAPLQGETVGVGMPVIVHFDIPVTDRAAIERHMSVSSTPKQPGAWHWISDQEVHFRPRTYWQPGSHVAVDVAINSIDAGNGIYGQENRHVEFDVGDSVVSKVDVDAHQMQVFVNGDLARTIPISAGKPGWETRSGTKVIIEKFRRKRMNAATIGVDKDSPEYYNLANVEYAMRVTYSGEFLHAAPWSVGSQGSANVSHGCVGMSTADAKWLYDITKRGDVVEVTGSDRYMTLTNGYGDWNESFAEYKAGSALS